MPTYELAMMLRSMTRPELITTLKRTSTAIFDKGGFIRQIDNLGTRNLPFKVSEHGLVHKTGTAFIIKFDAPPKTLQDLYEEYGRDIDILRRTFLKVPEPEPYECTLEEEIQPPAYRKDVIELMNVAKKKQKEKYPHNSGLSYYPFQK